MSDALYIGEAARRLNGAPEHLRTLEREDCISLAPRDLNGRVCSELDLAFLRAMEVGRRPRRLMSLEELPEATP